MLSVSVSVMVFTLDEEINLPYCLDSLSWCDDVIVVELFQFRRHRADLPAKRHPLLPARIRGLRQPAHLGSGARSNTAHMGALIRDADERVPLELAHEMAAQDSAAWARTSAPFKKSDAVSNLWGRWLRWSSLYPTWVVRPGAQGPRPLRRPRPRRDPDGHWSDRSVDHDLIDAKLKGIDAWFKRQIDTRKRTRSTSWARPPPIARLPTCSRVIHCAADRRSSRSLPACPVGASCSSFTLTCPAWVSSTGRTVSFSARCGRSVTP